MIWAKRIALAIAGLALMGLCFSGRYDSVQQRLSQAALERQCHQLGEELGRAYVAAQKAKHHHKVEK